MRGCRRALPPWSVLDQELLAVVSRGEYTLQGFRHRDVVAHLYPQACGTEEQRRRAAPRVTRLLRLLRAHGLVRKIAGTRRYRLIAIGRAIATAVLRYQSVTLQQLNKIPA